MGTALLAGSLIACAPGFDMVRTSPSLYPVFQLSVTDYVNRCDPDQPTDVTVTAPEGTAVSINGQPEQGGTFTTQVDQQVNERFTIVVNGSEMDTTHHVRCLPLDFPEWDAVKTGATQTPYYATVMIQGFNPNQQAIFDSNGVPVWWGQRERTFSLEPLPNGNLASLFYGGGMVERSLDGTPVRTLNTVGAPSDFHDVEVLPNGNYVLATFDVRDCSLALWGQGPSRCAFHTFQELEPDGDVAWSWAAEDDIPISETPVKWRSESDAQFGTVDPWHYNSVEWTGDGFIISFRHLDAIYKIDHHPTNPSVVWKLGGTPRAESLQVRGDPVFTNGGSISGQHDARLLPGGIVSLFDNGSKVGRAPRSVAYRIDEGARTATLVSRITDSVAPASGCCGSTRVLSGGNQVTGFGGTPWITEHEPNGNQVFRLDANFVYRAIPITDGRYTPQELRDGMDAQFDDGVFAPGASASISEAEGEAVGDLEFRLGLD